MFDLMLMLMFVLDVGVIIVTILTIFKLSEVIN